MLWMSRGDEKAAVPWGVLYRGFSLVCLLPCTVPSYSHLGQQENVRISVSFLTGIVSSILGVGCHNAHFSL